VPLDDTDDRCDAVTGSARRFDTVSFLTDYGTRDEFVGVVKSVIRDLAPHVAVVDLTHEIPPFDVRAGSLALARCIGYVPAGVVLAVVDPGVGTDRRAVAVEVAGGAGVMIGPDNGLLAPAVAMAGGASRAVVLTNPDYQLEAAGTTFAGRDVFNLGPDDLEGWDDRVSLRIDDPTAPGETTVRTAVRSSNFAGIGGGIGLVLDSYGMLAVCLDRRSAAAALGIGPGDQIALSPPADPAGNGIRVKLGRQ
jgi:S-adenosylmethionine hydrolase